MVESTNMQRTNISRIDGSQDKVRADSKPGKRPVVENYSVSVGPFQYKSYDSFYKLRLNVVTVGGANVDIVDTDSAVAKMPKDADLRIKNAVRGYNAPAEYYLPGEKPINVDCTATTGLYLIQLLGGMYNVYQKGEQHIFYWKPWSAVLLNLFLFYYTINHL